MLTHGKTNTPEFAAWSAMRWRCRSTKHAAYKWYGARGITVCERWDTSFENFLNDMGYRPTAKHTLERKDNDGPYSPDNCEWATMKQQANNRRSSIRHTWNGRTQTLAQWADELGLERITVYQRVKHGWPIDQALTRPVVLRGQLLQHDGQTHTISEWAAIAGLRYRTLQSRLNQGESLADALRPAGKHIEYNGQKRTITEWSRALNIPFGTLTSRLHAYGWSVERALTTPVHPMKRTA